MELTHRFTVPVSIEAAWSAFNDLDQIVPCFPGAALTSFDGERFDGLCKVKLGPISLQYTGSGRFVERDVAAKRALIEAAGKDRRGNGTASAAVTAQLTATGESSTTVEVKTNLTITGRPAQFGRGVMQDVSDRLLAQFSACLENQLGSGISSAEETGAAATTQPDQPDQPRRLASLTAEQSPAAPAVKAPVPPAAGPVEEPAAFEAAVPVDEPAASEAAVPVDSAEPQRDAGAAETAELNLGSAIVPVLLRRYAPRLVAALVVAVLVKKLSGRR